MKHWPSGTKVVAAKLVLFFVRFKSGILACLLASLFVSCSFRPTGQIAKLKAICIRKRGHQADAIGTKKENTLKRFLFSAGCIFFSSSILHNKYLEERTILTFLNIFFWFMCAYYLCAKDVFVCLLFGTPALRKIGLLKAKTKHERKWATTKPKKCAVLRFFSGLFRPSSTAGDKRGKSLVALLKIGIVPKTSLSIYMANGKKEVLL